MLPYTWGFTFEQFWLQKNLSEKDIRTEYALSRLKQQEWSDWLIWIAGPCLRIHAARWAQRHTSWENKDDRLAVSNAKTTDLLFLMQRRQVWYLRIRVHAARWAYHHTSWKNKDDRLAVFNAKTTGLVFLMQRRQVLYVRSEDTRGVMGSAPYKLGEQRRQVWCF